VLSHAPGSSLNGYTLHRWNGVTAPALGAIVAGQISGRREPAGTIHIVPDGAVTKAELATLMLAAYGRSGVEVVPTDAGTAVDRTLATVDAQRNSGLWEDAGYASVPSIGQLVAELPRAWAKDGV
jgi:dTDP-4-dehydrorhamnose reductase